MIAAGSGAIDGMGTCEPSTGGNKKTSPPPSEPTPVPKPVWYGFASWLADIGKKIIPAANPAVRTYTAPASLPLTPQTKPCVKGNTIGATEPTSSGGLATISSCAIRACQQWKNPSPQYTYQECLKDVPNNIIAIQDTFTDAVSNILNNNPQYRSRTYVLNVLESPTKTKALENGIADTARTCAAIKEKPTVTWMDNKGRVTTATQTKALADCDAALQDPIFRQIFDKAKQLDDEIVADIKKRDDAVKKCSDDFNATGESSDFSNPNCLETPPACVGP